MYFALIMLVDIIKQFINNTNYKQRCLLHDTTAAERLTL